MNNSDEYLLLSGIQHFCYCRRQWALIHVESLWEENVLTISGDIMHARAHDHKFSEKRKNLIVTRGIPVFSHKLRIRGVCDVVEFYADASGVPLSGRKGLWLPCPVEYKRGKPKIGDEDRVQLCAQAMCLEEMLVSPPIETAYVYYGETKRRETVTLSQELRGDVYKMFEEMQDLFARSFTPKPRKTKKCNNCSFKDVCLPTLTAKGNVSDYIRKAIMED